MSKGTENDQEVDQGPWILVDSAHRQPDTSNPLFKTPDGPPSVKVVDAQTFDSKADAQAATDKAQDKWTVARLSDYFGPRTRKAQETKRP